MLLKYHPEWQFRLQSYKHLRSYTALFLYKRKLETFIHVNKIVLIVACFQDETFSLQFQMYCGAMQVHLKLFLSVTGTQKRACGPCETHALGHFFLVKQSWQGQHQRMQTVEPQASTSGSPDTEQAMQRAVDSRSTAQQSTSRGC